jgi:hypothetical protein
VPSLIAKALHTVEIGDLSLLRREHLDPDKCREESLHRQRNGASGHYAVRGAVQEL